MSDPVLGKRYRNDGVPSITLNELQHAARARVVARIKEGTYAVERVSHCPCGKDSFALLSEKDRFGLPFGSVLCRSCGLLCTTPHFAAEALPRFYAEDYHSLIFGREEVETFKFMGRPLGGRLLFEFVQELLPSGEELRIAEIGCGAGGILDGVRQKASAQYARLALAGCEYSEVCAEFARREFNLDIVQGGIDALVAAAERPYDLVILSHVLEHFVDLSAELRKIRSLLHAGSIVYIEVPGILDLRNKAEYLGDFLRYRVCAHTFDFCLGTLERVMAGDGFRLERGNEFVRSAFRLADTPTELAINRADYVLEYLTQLERDVDCLRGPLQRMQEVASLSEGRRRKIEELNANIRDQARKLGRQEQEIRRQEQEIRRQEQEIRRQAGEFARLLDRVSVLENLRARLVACKQIPQWQLLGKYRAYRDLM